MGELALRRVRHRIKAHRAALRLTAELGEAAQVLLDEAVHDTEVRIDEAEQILAILEEET